MVIKWQQVTMSDNEWYNEWQWMKMSDKWYNKWQQVAQRVRASDNKWERVIPNDNEWQQVTVSGTTNENSTVHFKEWMIAILSMTKTDKLRQGVDGYN